MRPLGAWVQRPFILSMMTESGMSRFITTSTGSRLYKASACGTVLGNPTKHANHNRKLPRQVYDVFRLGPPLLEFTMSVCLLSGILHCSKVSTGI